MTGTNHIEGLKAEDAPAGKGRRQAGGDPKKRRQILDAAHRIFAADGFDATAMDMVAARSGVSKSTLYVYFKSKEHLFGALVEEERQRYLSETRTLLSDPSAPADMLTIFGVRLATKLTSKVVVQANRTLIGVAERMPDFGRDFYLKGPARSIEILAEYLDRSVAVGALAIADTPRAAAQFIDLSTSTLLKPRLFNQIADDPEEEEIAATVDSAVRLFMAGYGRSKAGVPEGVPDARPGRDQDGD